MPVVGPRLLIVIAAGLLVVSCQDRPNDGSFTPEVPGETQPTTTSEVEPPETQPRRQTSDEDAPSASEELLATTTTSTPAPPSWCSAADTWDRAAQLSQLVMVGVDTRDSEEAREVLSGSSPVGALFLLPGDDGLLQDGALLSVKDAASVEPLVAIDDEGGRVQRLERIGGALPSAREQTRTMRPSEIRDAARVRGELMRSIGIDIDFAPVVDVSAQPADEVIGDRSYGTSAAVVIEHAGAFADGLREAGIVPTLKHFPGHGRAIGDSHDGPAMTPPLADLVLVDLQPYVSLLETNTVVMTGHLDVPGLTEPGIPASLSPSAYDLLRKDLDFDGLTITDDLSNMDAVTTRFDTPNAAAQALAAGADMVLVGNPEQLGSVMQEITHWANDGRLDESRIQEALRRVLGVKGCRS